VRKTILIAGNGKLANKLKSDLPEVGCALSLIIDAWDNRQEYTDYADIVIVHVGSGRQLPEITAYCRQHTVPLLQGATGVEYDPEDVDFSLVIAPNFSVLLIKFMHLLRGYGRLFQGYDISLVESHQATKNTTPGTAVEIAQSVGVPSSEIISVRDPNVQQHELHIPAEFLDQHAVHLLKITDGSSALTMTTEVMGLDSYVAGALQVIKVLDRLEAKKYQITDLISMGLV
jgi:dihydrodipicolinate reductase